MTTDVQAYEFPTLQSGQRVQLAPMDMVAAENLGSDGLNPTDWTRVTFPREGVQWRVPDPGDPNGFTRTDELIGVVVAQRVSRTLYLSEYDPDDVGEPDCRADDGVHGVTPWENPVAMAPDGEELRFGGLCVSCPLNQFGSLGKLNATESRGKACTEYRHAYLLQPDSPWPIDVRLPPTQLKAWRDFATQLTQRGIPFKYAIVRLAVGEDGDNTFLKASLLDVLPEGLREGASELQQLVFAMATPPQIEAPAATPELPPPPPEDELPF